MKFSFLNIKFILLIMFGFNICKAQETSFFFDQDHFTRITELGPKAVVYKSEVGFGFDFDTHHNVEIKKRYISSDKPFYFSIKLKEGKYRVTVDLGGDLQSKTTIKAESKRLMVKELNLQKNEISTVEFSVDVRSPEISQNSIIAIKDRDKDQLNWDNKLTLEFSGKSAVRNIKIVEDKSIRTLFLAGDSTVADQDVEPWASWGQYITNFFIKDIVVANYAESGASLASFISTKRFEKILSLIKPNDYVLIEFSHNDQKRRGEGIGPWQSFTRYLKHYISSVRDKGGVPMLCTPTQRRYFNDDGSLKETHGDYPDAIRKVAEELDVWLVDVSKMTKHMYEAWGDANSKMAFVHYPKNTFPGQKEALADNTHFNNFGAYEISKSIVQSIRESDFGIAQYLKPNIPIYNPKFPSNFADWTVPMSPRFEIIKPAGN